MKFSEFLFLYNEELNEIWEILTDELGIYMKDYSDDIVKYKFFCIVYDKYDRCIR